MEKIDHIQLIDDLKQIYAKLIPKMSLRQKFVTIYRPLYAPVKEILQFLDPHSSVLEVGCGTGPILQLINKHCKIRHGLGIDIDRRAIDLAKNVNSYENLQFEARNLYDIDKKALRSFNLFLCFDILHHIPKKEKMVFLNYLTDSMKKKDRLILKDLDEKPFYKSFANRITDFISSRSFVSYEHADTLVAFFEKKGLKVLAIIRPEKWIWSHYVIVVQK